MPAIGRITGKLGAVYVDTSGSTTVDSFVKVADIYNWEYEETLNTFNCTIKGEAFSRFRPGQNSARVIAQRYIQTIAVLSPLVEYAIAGGLPISFELFAIDGDTAHSRVIGQGYVTRGRITGPQEKMTDELEIQVDGIPRTVT